MRKESGSTNLNTYITDHLPANFQEQRKLLLPMFPLRACLVCSE